MLPGLIRLGFVVLLGATAESLRRQWVGGTAQPEAPPEKARSEEPEPEAEPEGRARRAMRWLLASKADPDAASDNDKKPEPDAAEPTPQADAEPEPAEAPRARPTPRAAPSDAPADADGTDDADATAEPAAPARPRPHTTPSADSVVLTKDEQAPSPRPSPRAAAAAETSTDSTPAGGYDASDPEADARMARFLAASNASVNATATSPPTAEGSGGKDWFAGTDNDESDAEKPSLINRLLHPRKAPSAATASADTATSDADTSTAEPDKTADTNDAKSSDAKPSDAKDGDAEKDKSKASGRGRKRLIRLAIFVVIIVGVGVLVRTYVAAPYYIPSASMEPTLHGCNNCNDDHVIVDKFSYRLHEPEQTDIVVFERPPNLQADESVLIKRVVAVPGDTVVLRRGKVIVNGKALKETYLNQTYLARECRDLKKATGTNPLSTKSRWKIPKGEVFVMGDNRCDSIDSRKFGPIKESSVIGRAFAIVWPLKRLRTL